MRIRWSTFIDLITICIRKKRYGCKWTWTLETIQHYTLIQIKVKEQPLDYYSTIVFLCLYCLYNVQLHIHVHSLWKVSLNSNGNKFHQYQQNHEKSPLILTKHKQTTTANVRNPGHGLGQAQKCVRVKPINGILTILSW